MGKKKWLALVIALSMTAGMTLSACGGEEETTAAETTTAEETTTAAETTTAPETTAPEIVGDELPEGYMYSYLTGEPVPVEIGMRRPVAFQIDNEKIAQPQNGVAQAEVVYEVPIEAYEVRLTAIFQDWGTVQRIGPLRSARSYHPGICAEFDAIFFHNGRSVLALPFLNDDRCDDLEGIENSGWPAMFRGSDHRNGHNDFTSPEKTDERIEKLGFRRNMTEDFAYKFLFTKPSEPNMLENGESCSKIEFGHKQNKPWFQYNEEDGLYYRYAYNEEHIDQDNDQQVAVKNIIVQYCAFHLEYDHDTKDIHTVDTGTGVFVTNGKYVPITWEKENYWENTHYYYDNGEEIQLNPGKTWVTIVLPSFTGGVVIEP